MKKRIYILPIFFLIFGFFTNIYCISNCENELKGVNLCNNIYNYLEEKNFSPSVQALVQNGNNNFPYNIIVRTDSTITTDKNLIFTFFQEDFIENKNCISDFIEYIKNHDYDFNTIILFSYGEKQNIKKDGMIYGIDTFLNTISTNDDYSNIIINLSSDENSINTSSKGIVAPSWLIQNQFNTYIKNGIDEDLPYFYLSQIYTYNFFYDRILTSFFKYNIPSIKLNLNAKDIGNVTISNILIDSIEAFYGESERIWDHHFFMVKINNNYKKLTEERTIQFIICIIFIWLLFIILFIFINSRRKKQAWATIKHIWYTVPITLILSSIGFIIGKIIFIAFLQSESDIQNAFLLFEIQIIISFLLVSIFYAITLLYNYRFYEKSIDYLIVISCFFNQSFFILIDISLFPIFMIICLLSIIALYVRSNGVHIAIFFLMTIPFLPYILSLINYADFTTLYNFLISEKLVHLFIPLIIYPSYLIYFRILTSIRRKSKINVQALILLIVIGISMSILLVGTLKGTNIEKRKAEKEAEEEIFILVTTEDLIDFNYTDKEIFDDLIRTINISFTEQPEQCTIILESDSKTPILYTDNDYEYINPTTSMFNIPSVPPKDLTFSYGTSKGPSIISISAVFPTGNKLDYKTTKKVVTIE